MRFGVVQIVDGTPGRGLEFIRGTSRCMEDLGFSTFWAPDHVVFFDDYLSSYPHSEDGSFGFKEDQGLLEPLMVLQVAAAATDKLRVGTSVEILPERNPVVRAKHVATLDHFSGGRVDYGIGIGWSKEEYAAVGVPWERRGTRTDEYLGAMTALWTQHRATYQGEFVSFRDVVAFPKPIQQPRPPILVGGVTDAAIRRAVHHGDGWYGWKLTLDQLDDRLEVIDRELAAVGRGRDDFKVYLGAPHHADADAVGAHLEQVAARGVDQYVFGLSLSRDRYAEQLEAYAKAAGLDRV